MKLQNSDVLENLPAKLSHLSSDKQEDISSLILEYKHLFSDTLGRTDMMDHDVDVGDAAPIKQHPYRVSPMKREKISEEVKSMLRNEIIEPCKSDWSSPCILVPKPDGSN